MTFSTLHFAAAERGGEKVFFRRKKKKKQGREHNPGSICGREYKVPLCQRDNTFKDGDVILP